MSAEKGMPTVQNVSEVQQKCGVRGENQTSGAESTMNRNVNPVEEGEDPRRRGGVMASLPRQKPSRGRRGAGGGSHDDFCCVEISIAGGEQEMVRDVNVVHFFIFFIYLFIYFF